MCVAVGLGQNCVWVNACMEETFFLHYYVWVCLTTPCVLWRLVTRASEDVHAAAARLLSLLISVARTHMYAPYKCMIMHKDFPAPQNRNWNTWDRYREPLYMRSHVNVSDDIETNRPCTLWNCGYGLCVCDNTATQCNNLTARDARVLRKVQWNAYSLNWIWAKTRMSACVCVCMCART